MTNIWSGKHLVCVVMAVWASVLPQHPGIWDTRETLSVLLCSQSPNVKLAVPEERYTNSNAHEEQEKLDLLLRSKMGEGSHPAVLSRAENTHSSRKAHSSLKSVLISRFIQCPFHVRQSSWHLPSESSLPIKGSLKPLQRPLFYGI